MKKIAIIATVALIAGCAQISKYTGTSGDDSVRAKMTTCMMSEANTRLQNGTLFVNSVSSTAKDLVGTCAKRLALGSVGITSENQTAAENIITNLKALSSAKQ